MGPVDASLGRRYDILYIMYYIIVLSDLFYFLVFHIIRISHTANKLFSAVGRFDIIVLRATIMPRAIFYTYVRKCVVSVLL